MQARIKKLAAYPAAAVSGGVLPHVGMGWDSVIGATARAVPFGVEVAGAVHDIVGAAI